MISIQQFSDDVKNAVYARYDDRDNLIILKDKSEEEKEDIVHYCLDILKNEGTIKEKDGMLYICMDFESVFDEFKDLMDMCDLSVLEEFHGRLFPISSEFRTEMDEEDKQDATQAILSAFDKWFGYETEAGDGIVGITFEDVKKQYELYRTAFGGDSFEDKVKEVFGDDYDRFMHFMGNPMTDEEYKAMEDERRVQEEKCEQQRREKEMRQKLVRDKEMLDDIKELEKEDINKDNWDLYKNRLHRFMDGSKDVLEIARPIWKKIMKLEEDYENSLDD